MNNLIERLIKYNQPPLLPDKIQLKYEAMAENAFRFYRGTCHLFYEDIAAGGPKIKSPATWICGDLHIENFGSYKGDNKLVYFDLNDFDEALLAPAHFELGRMVCSIFMAFESLGIEREKAFNMARLFLKTYAATLVKGKAISIEPRTAKGIVCDFLQQAAKTKRAELLKKRTISKKKKIMLSLEDERHFKLDRNLRHELKLHVDNWIANSSDGPYNYKAISAVFRLAGTGSVGQKRYLVLLKSTNTKNKYLLVDMKQSRPSCVSQYTDVKQPAWTNDAERIITVQQRMQNVSASLLSTTLFRDEPYVLQELQPVKDTINFKLLKDNYRNLYQVIDDMAALTASSQLRSGGIQKSAIIDQLMAFGARDNWQNELIEYSAHYARVSTEYYKEFLAAFKAGTLR
ncbi:MAG TPA: DUF2252 family protein [Mucilaginibacter sp.]|nr:DUF2252 family protein [Mucilaginibacter sp.]